MKNKIYSSSHKGVYLDTIFIYLILYSILLISITNIVEYQEGVSARWWTYHTNSKLLTLVLDIFFLLIYFCKRLKMDVPSIKVLLCLAYTAFVATFIYTPSYRSLFADGFTWPLTYLVFFLYFKNKDFPEGFKKALLLCHLICCLLLIRTFATTSILKTNRISPVYHAIVYLPMIFLLGNKREKIIHSIIASILVILSTKRTGILSLITGIGSFFIVTVIIQKSAKQKWKSILTIAFVVLILIVLYFCFASALEGVLFRFQSLSEDQGSGRMLIWKDIIARYQMSSWKKKLFGHGFHAVPYLIRPQEKYIFAHNSYLEFLYDLGFIGLMMCLLILIDVFRFLAVIIKRKSRFAPFVAFAVCIIVMFSFTSYFFDESNYNMLIICFWGAIRGVYMRESKTSKTDT